MTPDEWRKGMENEAASVEDSRWAAETQQSIERPLCKSVLLLVIAMVIYGGVVTLVSAGSSAFIAGIISSWIPHSRLTYSLVGPLQLLLPSVAGWWLTRLSIPPVLSWAVTVSGYLLWLLAGQFIDIPVDVWAGTGGGSGIEFDLLPSLSDLSSIPALDLLRSLIVNAVAVVVGIALADLARRRALTA